MTERLEQRVAVLEEVMARLLSGGAELRVRRLAVVRDGVERVVCDVDEAGARVVVSDPDGAVDQTTVGAGSVVVASEGDTVAFLGVVGDGFFRRVKLVLGDAVPVSGGALTGKVELAAGPGGASLAAHSHGHGCRGGVVAVGAYEHEAEVRVSTDSSDVPAAVAVVHVAGRPGGRGEATWSVNGVDHGAAGGLVPAAAASPGEPSRLAGVTRDVDCVRREVRACTEEVAALVRRIRVARP